MSDVAFVSEHACGTMKFYLEDKGYGFIERADQTDVFVHANELKKAGIDRKNIVGASFAFDVVSNERGPKAVNLKRVG